jgi:hypothetical protein
MADNRCQPVAGKKPCTGFFRVQKKEFKGKKFPVVILS